MVANEAPLKVIDLLHQVGWSAANLETNNTFKMAALLAPPNLRPDLMMPTKAKQKQQQPLAAHGLLHSSNPVGILWPVL